MTRSEGPAENRPDRKVGITDNIKKSTEGAALGDFSMCRALGAHLINYPNPGLTAGPIPCRPFGPQNEKANLDRHGLQP